MTFFDPVLLTVGNLRSSRYKRGDGGSVAGQVELSLANGKTLYVLDAFHVENGEMIEQESHYDLRPAAG